MPSRRFATLSNRHVSGYPEKKLERFDGLSTKHANTQRRIVH